jgi:hypothetical protein
MYLIKIFFDADEIVTATTDPALHSMQTVGRLSAVAARRVWANLACKINQLRDSGQYT